MLTSISFKSLFAWGFFWPNFGLFSTVPVAWWLGQLPAMNYNHCHAYAAISVHPRSAQSLV